MRSLFVFVIFPLQMLMGAAPIFHAISAKMYLETRKPTISKEATQSFILGTLFPDIRHQESLPRHFTHDEKVTLQDVETIKNPFFQGLRFHSYVDKIRREFVQRSDILNVLKDYPGDKQLFLKELEDAVLYNLYGPNYLRPLVEDLKTVNIHELQFNISYSKVLKWHDFLMICFRYPPEVRFKMIELDETIDHFNESTLKNLTTYLPKYQNNPEIISHTKSLLFEFQLLYKQSLKDL